MAAEDDVVNSGHKRRNSIPSAVILPTNLHNGHHNHHHNHHHYYLSHHHSHQSSPSPSPSPATLSADFELVSFKPDDSYTSLKDLIPTSSATTAASILSPTPPNSATTALTAAVSTASSGGSGYEISIRNRLVKQAAWAYLQPTVTSSPSSSRRFFFFSGEFLRPLFAEFRRFVVESVTRGYDWLVDALWLILCR